MSDNIFGPEAATVIRNVENELKDEMDHLEIFADKALMFAEREVHAADNLVERGVDTMYAAGAADVQTGGEMLSRIFGALMVASCFIVCYLTLRTHARNFVSPLLQTCIVRIVLLAPLCGLLAFLTLIIGGNIGVLFDMCRASYEGFCIYSFLALLLVYVGGPRKCAALLADCQYPGLSFSLCPLCKCGTVCQFRDGHSRVWWWQAAVLQMSMVKPITAGFLSYSHKLVDDAVGTLHSQQTSTLSLIHDGLFRSASLGLIFRFLNTLSTAAATHTLLEAYCSLKPLLTGLQPVRKFFVMKILIALLLAQDILIDGWLNVQQTTLVEKGAYGKLEHFVRQTHTVIVMVEMLFFALMFYASFSASSINLSYRVDLDPARARIENSARTMSTRREVSLGWLIQCIRRDVYDTRGDGEETAEVGELQVEVVESSKTTSVSWNKTGLIQTPGTPTRSSAVKT